MLCIYAYARQRQHTQPYRLPPMRQKKSTFQPIFIAVAVLIAYSLSI